MGEKLIHKNESAIYIVLQYSLCYNLENSDEGEVDLDVQLKKGTLELCVLALLEKEEMYGYEIVTKLSEEMDMTVGTIYPLLKRIKQDGYVETKTVDSPTGPSRKYYYLTAKGQVALAEYTAEWQAFIKTINKIIGTGKDL